MDIALKLDNDVPGNARERIDQDLPVLCRAADPRRQVHDVADRGVVAAARTIATPMLLGVLYERR
jgi:hypothetical protein